MTKAKKEKLLEIADMLVKHRDTKKLSFNMDTWKSAGGVDIDGNKCGTACCAIGMAVEKKIFPNTFRLVNERPTYITKTKYGIEFSAVASYLQISRNDAVYLFDPTKYPSDIVTKAQVIKRIREFVKQPLKTNIEK